MKSTKELRTALNMNIKRFSEFTGIPYRTIQNWERNINNCPSYVLALLNEQIRPYIENNLYTYKRYTWFANVGTDHNIEEKIFLTRESATIYAFDYWNHLTHEEQKKHHAYIGMCQISLDDLTPATDTSDGIFYQEYIED